MARQEQQHRSEREPEDITPPPPPPTGGAAQAQQSDLDSLLGEIDSVLETNAESFVRGFVQKGGQ